MASNMKWSSLSAFLKEDSEIPTDIAFEIVDESNTNIATVKAHKFVLAVHSVFFQKTFFGSGLNFKESSGTVIIKETTKEAFSAMIDFIYEKNIYFANKTVEEFFDILNVSKRYQVEDLTLAITNHFKNFPWAQRWCGQLVNVVKSVAYAEEFEQFPDETKALIGSAAIFLKKELTSVSEVLTFISDKSSDHPDVAVRLLAEVKKLPCDDCWKFAGIRCINGEFIRNFQQLKPGQLVKTRPMHHWREKYRGKLCQVIEVKAPDIVKLQFLKPPSPADDDVPNGLLDNWHFRSCDLLFVCDPAL